METQSTYLQLIDELRESARSGGIGETQAQEVNESFRALPELMYLYALANEIRCEFKGNDVDFCSIVNIKSGNCPEDCGFCAQSARHETGVQKYPFLSDEQILKAAHEAKANGAWCIGLVEAVRGASKQDIARIKKLIPRIQEEVGIEVHASLGILGEDDLRELKDAGMTMFNHNLETSPSYFSRICTTHSYQDRINTVENVRKAGMQACCGCIWNMGESEADRLEIAFELKKLNPSKITINILNPLEGTPLGHRGLMQPLDALKYISLYRLIVPQTNISVCGGREVNLRSLQPMMYLAGANASMVGNYLTTTGAPPDADHAMLRDLQLELKTRLT